LLRCLCGGGCHDSSFRIESGRFLLAEIPRRRLLNGVTHFRRIELDRLAEIFFEGKQQSAVMGAELLRISRIRSITFGAASHCCYL
jgi:hypothetical protein